MHARAGEAHAGWGFCPSLTPFHTPSSTGKHWSCVQRVKLLARPFLREAQAGETEEAETVSAWPCCRWGRSRPQGGCGPGAQPQVGVPPSRGLAQATPCPTIASTSLSVLVPHRPAEEPMEQEPAL